MDIDDRNQKIVTMCQTLHEKFLGVAYPSYFAYSYLLMYTEKERKFLKFVILSGQKATNHCFLLGTLK